MSPPQRARGRVPGPHLMKAITTHQVRVNAEPRPGLTCLPCSETRSSGLGIPARNKPLPALTSAQRPLSYGLAGAHQDASSPSARQTAPRGAARPPRRHSPSSPSPDRKPMSLLRVLNPKLPRNGDCSCPSEPGHIGSGRHLRGNTSRTVARAQQPPGAL